MPVSAMQEATVTTSLGDRLAIRTVARISLAGPVPDANTVSRPLGVASDGRGRVYVTLMMWQTDPATRQKTESNVPSAVAVIDDATQAVVAYLPVGPLPRYVAADSVTGRVFVTHNAPPRGDTVTVIDGGPARLGIIGTLRQGRNALGVAVNPRTRRVYVAHAADARLSVIDADTLAVLDQVMLEDGIQIDRIAVDVATNRIYVPASRTVDNPATPWLYVIDGSTNAWGKVSLAAADPALASGAPRSVAINPTTGRIYVAQFGNANSVAVLGQGERSLMPQLITTIGNVGSNAADIQVDSARNLVFVANSTNPLLGTIALGISALDGVTNAVFALPQQVPQPSKASSGTWGLDVVERSGRVYITNPDDLSISVVETARLPRTIGEILFRGEGRWSEPLRLATSLASTPALVSLRPEQVDLFALANDGTLWHRHQEGEAWGDGESLGGALVSGPAAVAAGEGQLDVFAVGRDGALWHRGQIRGQWAAWESLGGALSADPPAVVAAAAQLDIFAIGRDGALWHRGQTRGQWAAWESLGGTLGGTPAPVLDSAGQLDVFALGADGVLWHRSQARGQWAAWEALGGTLTSPPAAVAVEPNQLHVFAMGSDGTVQHRVSEGTRWAAWESLGQMEASEDDAEREGPGRAEVLSGGLKVLASAPVVLARADKRLDVVAIGPGRSVQHATLSAGIRPVWEKVAGARSTSDKLTMVERAGGRLDVVMLDANAVRLHNYLPSSPPSVRMLRPKDLLNLEFDFFNLHVQAGNPPQLVRDKPYEDAFIVARFAPQHIVEEAFFEQDGSLQNMPGELEKQLIGSTITEDVRAQFARMGYPLGVGASLELKVDTFGQPGHKVTLVRWIVTDPGTDKARTYTISKNDEQLKVSANFASPQPQKDQVSRARLANRSWLVFKVSDDVTSIPYTYDGLLDIMRRSGLNVVPVATEGFEDAFSIDEPLPYYSYDASVLLPGQTEFDGIHLPEHTETISKLLPGHTAIELPYRLILSPNEKQRWHHETRVVSQRLGNIEWAELWHTRLEPFEQMALPAPVPAAPQAPGTPIVEPVEFLVDQQKFAMRMAALTLARYQRLAVRAIWSPDYKELHEHTKLVHYQDPPTPPPNVDYTNPSFRTSLDAKDRSELVHLTSNREVNGRDDVDVARIMLSALGGWIDVRGAWDSKDLDIQEWRHHATMGRDHYVRVVYAGYLMPFGHEASLVKVTERKFERPTDNTNGPAIAQLRQRMFIVVREPVRSLIRPESEVAAKFQRQIPFDQVQITTLVSPNLNKPEDHDIGGLGQEAFWPWVGNDPFQFHILAHDKDGQEVDFTLPLVFVSKEVARDDARLNTIIADYKAPLTLAINDSSSEPNKELRRAELHKQRVAFAPSSGRPGDATFEADSILFAPEFIDSQSGPQFYPIVWQARVGVPAIKRLLHDGDSVNIKYHESYYQNGFGGAANSGEVVADLVDEQGVPKASELNFVADGAPRMGLVTPTMRVQGLSRSHGPIEDPVNFAKGYFSPQALFGTTAKLLGGVNLASIVATTDKLSAPRLTSVEDGGAVVTTLEWQPAVQTMLPFYRTAATRLSVTVRLSAPLDGTNPSSKVTSVLENFEIRLLGAITVPFKKLEFISENGSKPDVNAEMGKLGFEGALGFVQALVDNIPDDGFKDPPFLDVGLDGVNAGYTLALPSIPMGTFSLQNIAVLAALSLPFNGDPANLRFQFASREQPFLVSVSALTGGGFFGLELGLDGIHLLEASLEFGGSIALNLGVARGAVAVMGGIYFKAAGNQVELTGFIRMSGGLEVLGLIAISVEFLMQLSYQSGGIVRGEATLTVSVDIGFFSKSVHLHVERQFAGSASSGGQKVLGAGVTQETLPTFVALIKEKHWAAYCAAFDDPTLS